MVSKGWHRLTLVRTHGHFLRAPLLTDRTSVAVIAQDGMLSGWRDLDLYHQRQRVNDDSLERGLFAYPSRLTYTRTEMPTSIALYLPGGTGMLIQPRAAQDRWYCQHVVPSPIKRCTT